MNDLRLFQYAGSFYPQKVGDISSFITEALKKANLNETIPNKPKIIIVPHAGYVYSGYVAAYAYKAISKFNYKNIFLLGPSHYVVASNQILTCTYKQFRTPLGNISTFKPENLPTCFKDDDAHALEHSLEVQLPFLQCLSKDYQIFPQLINEANEKSLTLISNYETDYLNKSDDKGEACGLTPILIGLKIAKKLKLKPILLKAANSGDASNSFNVPVVGYAAISFS